MKRRFAGSIAALFLMQAAPLVAHAQDVPDDSHITAGEILGIPGPDAAPITLDKNPVAAPLELTIAPQVLPRITPLPKKLMLHMLKSTAMVAADITPGVNLVVAAELCKRDAAANAVRQKDDIAYLNNLVPADKRLSADEMTMFAMQKDRCILSQTGLADLKTMIGNVKDKDATGAFVNGIAAAEKISGSITDVVLGPQVLATEQAIGFVGGKIIGRVLPHPKPTDSRFELAIGQFNLGEVSFGTKGKMIVFKNNHDGTATLTRSTMVRNELGRWDFAEVDRFNGATGKPEATAVASNMPKAPLPTPRL